LSATVSDKQKTDVDTVTTPVFSRTHAKASGSLTIGSGRILTADVDFREWPHTLAMSRQRIIEPTSGVRNFA
jgi:hypothetical protein